jgi:hypothetical protein
MSLPETSMERRLGCRSSKSPVPKPVRRCGPLQICGLAVDSRSVARDPTSDDALATEVEKMVVGRELGLVATLRRAEEDAPNPSLSAALAELLSAREARLAQFRVTGAALAAPVDPEDPVTAASWDGLANEATVGAALGQAFLQELRARLDRHVPLLDAALDSEPDIPDVLRKAAINERAAAATTKRVVHEMTAALLASPVLSARLGREGSLAAFAALFEALPS